MGDVHHCSRAPVSEMTYTVSSGTLNSTTIPYHTTDSRDGNSHLVNTYRTNYTSSWKLDSKEVDDGFFFCHNSVKVSAFLFHLAGILCHLFPSRRQYAESAVFPSSSSSGPVLLAHTDAANIDFRKVLTDSRRRDTCCLF